ncbi:MAG: restriction endonuclease [Myxococcota bacterium]
MAAAIITAWRTQDIPEPTSDPSPGTTSSLSTRTIRASCSRAGWRTWIRRPSSTSSWSPCSCTSWWPGPAVQCKAVSRPAGVAVARQLLGSMLDWGHERGILACYAGFTKPAAEFIADKPIEVIDLHDVLEMARAGRAPF